jgi:hypothetical protein
MKIEKHKGPDRFSIAFNIIPKGEFGPLMEGKLIFIKIKK